MPSSQTRSYYHLRNLIRTHDRFLKYRPIPDGPASAYQPYTAAADAAATDKPLDLTKLRRKHNPWWAVKSSLNVAGLAAQQRWINNNLWDAADRGDPAANARLFDAAEHGTSWYNDLGLYAGATAASIGQFARSHPYTAAAALGAAAFSAYVNNPDFDPKMVGRFYSEHIRPYMPGESSSNTSPAPMPSVPARPSKSVRREPDVDATATADSSRYITGKGSYYYRNSGGGYRSKIASFNPPPVFNNVKSNGAVIMSHREYLGDVYSATVAGEFAITKYPLNPGNEDTFPWLNRMAVNFQEYTLLGVLFEYRSMSGDALTNLNTALGSVIMATNYNAAAPDFTSKVEMENTQYAQSIKPSSSVTHPIECSPRQTAVSTTLYVRPSNKELINEDIRLYDWGNFYIATTGFQGVGVNCGELWVTYQVALRKPLLLAQYGTNAGYMHVYCYNTANDNVFGIYENQYIRVNTLYPKVTISNGVGPAYINFPGTAITRKYLIMITINTPAGTNTGLTATTVGGGIDFLSIFNASPRTAFIQKGATANSVGYTYTTAVRVNPGTQITKVQLSAGTFPAGTSSTELLVIEDPDLG